MAAETLISPVFELGRIRFRVKECAPEFERDLRTLFPHSKNQEDGPEILDVISQTDLRLVVNNILEQHQDCLWADAACLVSTTGKKFLLVGASSSGKSTTTMALGLGFGWKVLAEDVVLIDCHKNEVLLLPTPFSLKSGTAELLKKAVGFAPEPILQGEFFPMTSVASSETVKVPFDFAIVLDRRQPQLNMIDVTVNDFTRRLMPVSNILRMPKGDRTFASYLPKTCQSLSGGTVEERLDILREMAGEIE